MSTNSICQHLQVQVQVWLSSFRLYGHCYCTSSGLHTDTSRRSTVWYYLCIQISRLKQHVESTSQISRTLRGVVINNRAHDVFLKFLTLCRIEPYLRSAEHTTCPTKRVKTTHCKSLKSSKPPDILQWTPKHPTWTQWLRLCRPFSATYS